jgi:hypothetical protein
MREIIVCAPNSRLDIERAVEERDEATATLKIEQQPMSAPSVKPFLWHGIASKTIPSFPTINHDKDIGCELCFVMWKIVN